MTRTLIKLDHFCDLAPGEAPNVARHRGKGIGLYSSEARALEALRRVADKPGFRDHPDGFRLFDVTVDHSWWTEGFRRGADGVDVALADDPSPFVGDDSGLADWSDDDSRDAEDEMAYLKDIPRHRLDRLLWELWHCKISERNAQAFDDMGYKMIGLCASREAAEQAIARLRDKPGFRDWPGGFRVATCPVDHDGWTEGFVSADDDAEA